MYHRKKDYLLALIEQLFKYMNVLVNKWKDDPLQAKDALEKGFVFYKENFNVVPSDAVQQILDKLPAMYFIDEYAKLLVYEYNLAERKDEKNLTKALSLVNYLQQVDKTYSWDRAVLEQDILRLLEKHN